jgi:hypothetical protein
VQDALKIAAISLGSVVFAGVRLMYQEDRTEVSDGRWK